MIEFKSSNKKGNLTPYRITKLKLHKTMKKKLLIAAAIMFAVSAVKAQKPDTAGLMVRYKFSHVRDTNNRVNPYTENMVLLLGKKSSVYKSYDRQLENALFNRQLNEQQANSPDGSVKINRQFQGTPLQYYQFPAEKKMVRIEPLVVNSYQIDDALPAIDWKISNDTANFGGMHCQKATTHFKGRDYTAWFCPDLPFNAGPWKLNGLPGVIVDAYDAKKDIIFHFDGFEKVAQPQQAPLTTVNAPKPGDGPRMVIMGGDDSETEPAIIKLPSRVIKTTDKEFAKFQNAMHKDPDAFVQAMMASFGANEPSNGPRPIVRMKAGPQPVINNPIELSETR